MTERRSQVIKSHAPHLINPLAFLLAHWNKDILELSRKTNRSYVAHAYQNTPEMLKTVLSETYPDLMIWTSGNEPDLSPGHLDQMRDQEVQFEMQRERPKWGLLTDSN